MVGSGWGPFFSPSGVKRVEAGADEKQAAAAQQEAEETGVMRSYGSTDLCFN